MLNTSREVLMRGSTGSIDNLKNTVEGTKRTEKD